jgi:hypothetical protein
MVLHASALGNLSRKVAASMTCPGCGLPLLEGSRRGRPARYHNAACRQRAHRARLVNSHSQELDALAAVESAASEVRRALLAGESPDEAVRLLAETATALTRRLGHSEPALSVEADLVTNSDGHPAPASPAAAQPVTKSVTDSARPRQRRAPRTRRPVPLDVDTVRQERSTDPLRPGWRVVAGEADAPVLLGFLEPVFSVTGRRSSRWEARTERLTLVSGGPWRNRAAALVQLVGAYQRVEANMARRR